jgi:indole-3-glycerol phosphate synthase
MTDILADIVAWKQREVASRKQLVPLRELEKREHFQCQPLSLKAALLEEGWGIIAEHKRMSPSKGIINQQLGVEEVVSGYVAGGAKGLSVLTDEKFFDGQDVHLLTARKLCPVTPILRKDFIVEAYQVIETKSLGADALLLIAACLSPALCHELARLARSLGLEVLLEVHDAEEVELYYQEEMDLVGVNNRNLKLMKTDLNTSRKLSGLIPPQAVRVSESGISQPEVLSELRDIYGYQGFLIGEYFMQQSLPGKACQDLRQAVPAYTLVEQHKGSSEG